MQVVWFCFVIEVCEFQFFGGLEIYFQRLVVWVLCVEIVVDDDEDELILMQWRIYFFFCYLSRFEKLIYYVQFFVFVMYEVLFYQYGKYYRIF